MEKSRRNASRPNMGSTRSASRTNMISFGLGTGQPKGTDRIGARSHRHHRRAPAQPQAHHRRDPEEGAGGADRRLGLRQVVLAFDTLYAEGQRRYIESLSAYARQFLGQMEKPRYDSIRGLSPTISIEQKTASNNPRSTVGTITEIHDYLRVLYARVGRRTATTAAGPSRSSRRSRSCTRSRGSPRARKFLLLAPLVRERKGEHRDVLEQVRKAASRACASTATWSRSRTTIRLDKKKKHTIEVVVDRLIAKPGMRPAPARLGRDGAAQGRRALVIAPEGRQERFSREQLACHHCGISFPELSPQSFSFNSPLGMCPECNGLGTRWRWTRRSWCRTPTVDERGRGQAVGAVGEGDELGTDIVRAVARERGDRPGQALEVAARGAAHA